MKSVTAISAATRRRDFLRVMQIKRDQLEKWQVGESVDLYFLFRRQEIGKCLKRWLQYVRDNPESVARMYDQERPGSVSETRGLPPYGTAEARNCADVVPIPFRTAIATSAREAAMRLMASGRESSR